MDDKSYVTMEQHQCPICLVTFETGSILMDQRLRNRFEHRTLTGYSPCKECAEKLDQGFIAMVETAGSRTGEIVGIGVARTGNVAFMRREAFTAIFNTPPPSEDKPPMVFIEPGVIEQLQAMTETHH